MQCSLLQLLSPHVSVVVLLPGQHSGWLGVVQFLVLVLVPPPQVWEQGPGDQGDHPPSPKYETFSLLPIRASMKWECDIHIKYVLNNCVCIFRSYAEFDIIYQPVVEVICEVFYHTPCRLLLFKHWEHSHWNSEWHIFKDLSVYSYYIYIIYAKSLTWDTATGTLFR